MYVQVLYVEVLEHDECDIKDSNVKYKEGRSSEGGGKEATPLVLPTPTRQNKNKRDAQSTKCKNPKANGFNKYCSVHFASANFRSASNGSAAAGGEARIKRLAKVQNLLGPPPGTSAVYQGKSRESIKRIIMTRRLYASSHVL